MNVQSPESQKKIRTVVIGCGRIASSHLAAIVDATDDATLAATVDTDLDRGRAAALRFGAGAVYGSLEELFANEASFDAVVICLPNHLHGLATIESARYGKHVLLEKPMANTPLEAKEMALAAERAGVVLAIAQRRRHYEAVRYLLDNRQRFGRLISVQISLGVRFEEPQAPWWTDAEKTGDLVMGLNAPHCLDFLQAIMEADPVRICAEGVRSRNIWGGFDEAMLLLAYPEDRLASVHISFNQFPSEDRKVLIFETGTVELRDDRHLTFNGETLVSPQGSESAHYLDGAIEFKRQYIEFIRAIRGLPNRSVLSQEGVRLVEVIDIARSSIFEHGGANSHATGRLRKN